MNRRVVGWITVVLLLLVGFALLDRQLFAAGKKKNASVAQMEAMETSPDADDEDNVDINDDEVAVDEFDIQEKQKQAQALVERGVQFCSNNSLIRICNAFTRTKEFVDGELYLFLLDTKGVVYAHGRQEDLLWENLWSYQDSFGSLMVQSMVTTAQGGGGWLTYEWSGAVKVSYVQKITIAEKDYILGCGFYPHSKKYAAIGLVKGAVSLFNQDVSAGRSIESAFSTMGYPLSEKFIFGDLYLYAVDFDGFIRAQGEDAGLIGINVLDRKDSKGKLINKDIISKLKDKEEGEGVWIEYTSKNAVKYAYAEKVKDEKGKYYFIACGYYPEIDRDKTVDLVHRGYQYMKASGVTVAAKEFTDKAAATYRLGDLFLFVYDMKGKCIAHGSNPSVVGQNQFDEKDQDGVYYIREMIDQAKVGGGWVDFKLKNSFQSTYVEKIDMGVDTYVIGSGMFPVTKPETMTLLVKSAVGALQTSADEIAFERFVSKKGEFVRGDLFVFVLDMDGYCYAWGEDHELIWKNIIDWKDDEGKPFIKNMIDQSENGSGHFPYKFNKRMRIDYVEQVEKTDRKYVVGSGFYR